MEYFLLQFKLCAKDLIKYQMRKGFVKQVIVIYGLVFTAQVRYLCTI